MLQQTRRHDPPVQSPPRRRRFHQHIYVVHRSFFYPLAYEGNHAPRKDEALGAASEVVHFLSAGRHGSGEREDGGAAEGEEEPDREGEEDEEDEEDGAVGKDAG